MTFIEFLNTSNHKEVIAFREKQENLARDIGELMFFYHTTHGLTLNTMVDIIKLNACKRSAYGEL